MAGCGTFAEPGRPAAGLYPEACAAWDFRDRQCAAIVKRAQAAAALDDAVIGRVHLLSFDRELTVGAGQIARVGFELADGTIVEEDVWCGGIAQGPACESNPRVTWSSGVDHDVPCAGEPPDGCATLPPTPPPAAVAEASPLVLDSLEIRIDRLGAYDIRVGAATLPNGYLSELSFQLEDETPDTYWFPHLSMHLESDVPGRGSAGSIYRDPFEGPEPVTVFVRFDVMEMRAPGVVRLRDIVVR